MIRAVGRFLERGWIQAVLGPVFLWLAVVFFLQGRWEFGLLQVLYAGLQAVVYTWLRMTRRRKVLVPGTAGWWNHNIAHTIITGTSWPPLRSALPHRVQDDGTIRAFKVANLYWIDGRAMFSAVALPGQFYGVDSVAHCAISRWSATSDLAMVEHGEVPDPACSCGFYGIDQEKLSAELLQRYYAPVRVRLEVEFYGRVIRHERGYRAQYQRVLGVVANNECLVCGGQASGFTVVVPPPGFVVGSTHVTPWPSLENAMIPVCSPEHSFRWLSAADVAASLGTEVRWGQLFPRRERG